MVSGAFAYMCDLFSPQGRQINSSAPSDRNIRSLTTRMWDLFSSASYLMPQNPLDNQAEINLKEFNLEIQNTESEIANLASKYISNKSSSLSLTYVISHFLKKGRYLIHNKNSFVNAIKCINPQRFSDLKSISDRGETFYRDYISRNLAGVHAIFQSYQFYQDQKNLSALVTKYKRLKSENDKWKESYFTTTVRIDNLKAVLEELQEEIELKKNQNSNGELKFIWWRLSILLNSKFSLALQKCSKVGESLIGIKIQIRKSWDIRTTFQLLNQFQYELQHFGFSNVISNAEKIKKQSSPGENGLGSELQKFLESIKNCKSTEEIEELCKNKKIKIGTLPITLISHNQLIDNPNFINHLLKSYLFSKGITDPILIRSAFTNPLTKEIALEKALNKMKVHIKNHENESWEKIEDFFLGRLKIPKDNHWPLSIEAWKTSLADEGFSKTLTQSWINHQQSLIDQFTNNLEAAMKIKIKSERNNAIIQALFLPFEILCNLLEFVMEINCLDHLLDFIMIGSLLQCKPTVKSGIEAGLTGINKFNIPYIFLFYLLHPLYSKIYFKPINNLILITKSLAYYLFLRRNEYGYRGFELSLKINFQECLKEILNFFIFLIDIAKKLSGNLIAGESFVYLKNLDHQWLEQLKAYKKELKDLNLKDLHIDEISKSFSTLINEIDLDLVDETTIDWVNRIYGISMLEVKDKEEEDDDPNLLKKKNDPNLYKKNVSKLLIRVLSESGYGFSLGYKVRKVRSFKPTHLMKQVTPGVTPLITHK